MSRLGVLWGKRVLPAWQTLRQCKRQFQTQGPFERWCTEQLRDLSVFSWFTDSGGNSLSCAKACRTAPTHWKVLPMKIDHLRPTFWATHGTTGTARIAPILYDALMIPSRESVTFQTSLPFTRDEVPKSADVNTESYVGKARLNYWHLFHAGINWSPLIIWESKPEVISIPMQVGYSRRYRSRRFGFCHHFTLSSSTTRVNTGSASWPRSMKPIAVAWGV